MNMEQIIRPSRAQILQAQLSYKRGVKDTLLTLREVYGEGIEETDLWAEYMKEENN